MLRALKNHPFAVEAHFDRSLVLTYAVPVDLVQDLIPPCFTPDSFQNRWGFLAVALVQTRSLRPKGFPAWMGRDFFLAGFRVFVQYHTSAGKRLRGLYILKSETDHPIMTRFGNIFTHYQYSTTDIDMVSESGRFSVRSRRSDLEIVTGRREDTVSLPALSPFADWKEARRFSGPLPFTFTFNASRAEVLIVEGVRSNWTPAPVEVLSHHVGFLLGLGLKEMVLANAFEVKDIPYYWKKGLIDRWVP